MQLPQVNTRCATESVGKIRTLSGSVKPPDGREQREGQRATRRNGSGRIPQGNGRVRDPPVATPGFRGDLELREEPAAPSSVIPDEQRVGGTTRTRAARASGQTNFHDPATRGREAGRSRSSVERVPFEQSLPVGRDEDPSQSGARNVSSIRRESDDGGLRPLMWRSRRPGGRVPPAV